MHIVDHFLNPFDCRVSNSLYISAAFCQFCWDYKKPCRKIMVYKYDGKKYELIDIFNFIIKTI